MIHCYSLNKQETPFSTNKLWERQILLANKNVAQLSHFHNLLTSSCHSVYCIIILLIWLNGPAAEPVGGLILRAHIHVYCTLNARCHFGYKRLLWANGNGKSAYCAQPRILICKLNILAGCDTNPYVQFTQVHIYSIPTRCVGLRLDRS